MSIYSVSWKTERDRLNFITTTGTWSCDEVQNAMKLRFFSMSKYFVFVCHSIV